MARHAGVELGTGDWMEHGYDMPLLVNMQPAGQYLSERFHRAGGVPAVMWELLQAGKLDGSALTCTGRTQAENLEGREATDREVIYPYSAPLKERAGFLVLSGNLFDFAIMKTSVISDEFRQRYLSQAGHEGVFEGRAIVFDGSDDYHHRINDPSLDIDENCILVIRGSGPIGWPGSAEVVNMQPPDALLQRGITSLPTLGDGRQSGTSDSPSILNASPESAAGGGLAWLRTGDMIRIDLNAGTCDALVDDEEIARRKAEAAAADSAEQHAVGRAVPREDRPAVDRRRARVRGQISRHVKEGAAAQSLNRNFEHRRRQQVLVVEIDDRIVGPGVAHARRPAAHRRRWLTVLAAHPRIGIAAVPPAGPHSSNALALAPLRICSGLLKVTTIASPVRTALTAAGRRFRRRDRRAVRRERQAPPDLLLVRRMDVGRVRQDRSRWRARCADRARRRAAAR